MLESNALYGVRATDFKKQYARFDAEPLGTKIKVLSSGFWLECLKQKSWYGKREKKL